MASAIPKGFITTHFTVCCAICGEFWSDTADNKDKFIDAIDKEWRLTVEQGWVHKKCMKMMPNSLKFSMGITERDALDGAEQEP